MAAARKSAEHEPDMLGKRSNVLIFSGSELKYPFPGKYQKRNDEEADGKWDALVSHKPMAKNRRKRTYTRESVNRFLH
jgi:hypothetical protein